MTEEMIWTSICDTGSWFKITMRLSMYWH